MHDRVRRLKYYLCALDLIENTMLKPYSQTNPMRKSEILHRFIGQIHTGELFYVQIKENKHKQKYFMSVFPA